MRYYSASREAFFDSRLTGELGDEGSSLPADAVPLEDAAFEALMAAQAAGQVIHWTESGPAAADPPPPTPDQIQQRLTAHVQVHIDGLARSWGYDNAASAVGYAEEPAVRKFQLEGQAIRAWRSESWAAAAEILGQVRAGSRPVPDPATLLADLPAAPARPI